MAALAAVAVAASPGVMVAIGAAMAVPVSEGVAVTVGRDAETLGVGDGAGGAPVSTATTAELDSTGEEPPVTALTARRK